MHLPFHSNALIPTDAQAQTDGEGAAFEGGTACACHHIVCDVNPPQFRGLGVLDLFLNGLAVAPGRSAELQSDL